MKEVIFDVETQKLFSDLPDFNAKGLGVSVVSSYFRILDKDLNEVSGQISSFWHSDLSGLWEQFQTADRIIGFNSIHFDVPVLQPYTTLPLHKYNHLDIMDHIKNSFGRRISLNAIAKQTLGTSKTDVGTNAVLYWQKGDPESLAKLQSYCEADVILTKDIYDYGLKHNSLKFKDKWNTLREVKIDFSYPKLENSDQIGLF